MRGTALRALSVILALLGLQAALSLFYWLADPGLTTFLAPTWETLGFVAVIVLFHTLREGPLAGIPSSRVRPLERSFVAALALLSALYLYLGFAQGFARREFGYDLLLALHVRYVPSLFQMMYDAEPLSRFILYVAILVFGAALGALMVYLSVRRLHRFASTRGPRLRLAVAVGAYGVLAAPTVGISGSLTAEAFEQVHVMIYLDELLDKEAREMEVEVAGLRRRNPFERIEDPPSIYVLVVESYGAVIFRGDKPFERVRKLLDDQGRRLREEGFGVRSRYLEAPVFGGSSWMADASLLCGVRIPNQKRYEALFKSSAKCLPDLLNRAGYVTAIAASNTTYLEDRYARVFPFDHYFFRDDFAYKGRRFGWSFVPDQFTINFVDERIVKKHPDVPKFVIYQLSSSHHHWSQVPPYIEDWRTIDPAGEIYAKKGGQTFQNRFVYGMQYEHGYAKSIEYVLRTSFEYARKLPEDSLIIVLGDHQPRRPIGDINEDSWLVPIHILSRAPGLVERFSDLGYAPGMEPVRDPKSEDGMSDLVNHLFEAFASPEP